MSDSGRVIGECQHQQTRERCVECWRERAEAAEQSAVYHRRGEEIARQRAEAAEAGAAAMREAIDRSYQYIESQTMCNVIMPALRTEAGRELLERLKAAEAERNHYASLLSKEPALRLREGGFDVQHWAVKVLAMSLGDSFKSMAAKNYLSIEVQHPDQEIGWMVVTIQRKRGKSPAEIAVEAKNELNTAKAHLRALATFADNVRCAFVGMNGPSICVETPLGQAMAMLEQCLVSMAMESEIAKGDVPFSDC